MELLITAVCIILILIFVEICRELRSFRVTDYRITSKKLKGISEEVKVVFLSDLHNHVYGKDNQALIDAVKKADPVMILIGGDMLVGKNGSSYEPALNTVRQLTDICPVYYANGNHEQRLKEKAGQYEQSYEDYKDALERSGIHFLENDSVECQWGSQKIRITGLEIPLRCYTHFHKETPEAAELTERIGTAKQENFEILLAHNPSYMKEYIAWGADLVLSGHLHGGIVRIPGLMGVISPSFEIFPKYSGDMYREGDTAIVVSKGLGTHTINIRFLNPAEVIVLHFGGISLV